MPRESKCELLEEHLQQMIVDEHTRGTSFKKISDLLKMEGHNISHMSVKRHVEKHAIVRPNKDRPLIKEPSHTEDLPDVTNPVVVYEQAKQEAQQGAVIEALRNIDTEQVLLDKLYTNQLAISVAAQQDQLQTGSPIKAAEAIQTLERITKIRNASRTPLGNRMLMDAYKEKVKAQEANFHYNQGKDFALSVNASYEKGQLYHREGFFPYKKESDLGKVQLLKDNESRYRCMYNDLYEKPEGQEWWERGFKDHVNVRAMTERYLTDLLKEYEPDLETEDYCNLVLWLDTLENDQLTGFYTELNWEYCESDGSNPRDFDTIVEQFKADIADKQNAA